MTEAEYRSDRRKQAAWDQSPFNPFRIFRQRENKMSNKPQWERVNVDPDGYFNQKAITDRIRAPGGWIYRSTQVILVGGKEPALSESMTFVPDVNLPSTPTPPAPLAPAPVTEELYAALQEIIRVGVEQGEQYPRVWETCVFCRATTGHGAKLHLDQHADDCIYARTRRAHPALGPALAKPPQDR